MQREGRITEAVEVVRNNDGKRFMNEIRTVLSDLQSHTDDRLRIIVTDQLEAANTLRWVTIGGAVAILAVVGGSILLVFTYIRALTKSREDVDELNRHLEERVEERTRDLRRANQEIQRFAYIVTHDLRAPLVNIMGFLSEFDTSLKPVTSYILADGKGPTEEVIREARLAVDEDIPEAIGFIRSSTKKMDQLINAILKISRDGQRKLQPEKVDIETLLSSLSETVRHQITANGGENRSGYAEADDYHRPDIPRPDPWQSFRQRREVPDARPPAASDGTRLPGGAGRDLHRGGRQWTWDRRAGSRTGLRTVPTGRKPDQPGEGIGLAHVRSLIRNLGGDIKVESKLGEGSKFLLLLPSDLRRVTKEGDK